MTDEMDDAVFQSITKQCDEGSKLFHLERFAEALEHFKKALQLIPQPLENWEASTWVLSAIGDSLFLMGDAASARPYLERALECPGGLGNEFIHLRIGQVAFEQGEKDQAREHLARAYMGGGAELFEGEDPRYLRFLRKHMQGV